MARWPVALTVPLDGRVACEMSFGFAWQCLARGARGKEPNALVMAHFVCTRHGVTMDGKAFGSIFSYLYVAELPGFDAT